MTRTVRCRRLLVLVPLLAAAGCQGAPASGRSSASGPRLAVRGRVQEHNLSCESRAAADLLSYYGVVVEEGEFQGGLPRSDNPDLGFVGRVDDPCGGLPPEGYGVHAGPVARRLREFGVEAEATSGRDAAWLRERLDQGSPVLAWVTADLVPRSAVVRRDARGRAFRCVAWEHVVLVVGYDAGVVRAIDPASGTERRMPWRTFLAAWDSLGRMAVSAPPPPPGTGPPSSLR